MSTGAALLLLLTGITVLGAASVAAASPTISVSSFTAKPSALTWAGGSVTLSAQVTAAKTCTFSVTPVIKGLPTTKSCTNSTVSQTVTVPKNVGEKVTAYTFNLSVSGATTVEAKPTTVTVGAAFAHARIVSDHSGAYCAVLSTGGIDCWGANSEGELGNGKSGGPDSCDDEDDCYDTPQAVTGITNAVSVASNDYLSFCAVLSTGRVFCWGYSYYGELGNAKQAGPTAGGVL